MGSLRFYVAQGETPVLVDVWALSRGQGMTQGLSQQEKTIHPMVPRTLVFGGFEGDQYRVSFRRWVKANEVTGEELEIPGWGMDWYVGEDGMPTTQLSFARRFNSGDEVTIPRVQK